MEMRKDENFSAVEINFVYNLLFISNDVPFFENDYKNEMKQNGSEMKKPC